MSHPPRHQSGSLLIITLWLVTILSMLAIAIARYLSLEVRVTKYQLAREQAAALARSGLYLAMRRLAADATTGEPEDKAYDWAGDDWAEDPGVADGTTVTVHDENGRLSLNGISAEELGRLAIPAALVQTIVDARDAPDPAEDRPDWNPPYLAKNGLFAAAEELSDLPEMTPEAYNAIRASTTPYATPEEPLNINTVSPEVMHLVGLSDQAVRLVMQFREGGDGPEAHAEDGVFTDAGLGITKTLTDHIGVNLDGTPDGALLTGTRFGVSSTLFTIIAESRLERPKVRVRLEAVVRRTGCPDGAGPCVVAWRQPS